MDTLRIDVDALTVSLRDKSCSLSAEQMTLFRALVMAEGRALSRDTLFDALQQTGRVVVQSKESVDIYIKQLCAQLDAIGVQSRSFILLTFDNKFKVDMSFYHVEVVNRNGLSCFDAQRMSEVKAWVDDVSVLLALVARVGADEVYTADCLRLTESRPF